jgi:hypothetical protein
MTGEVFEASASEIVRLQRTSTLRVELSGTAVLAWHRKTGKAELLLADVKKPPHTAALCIWDTGGLEGALPDRVVSVPGFPFELAVWDLAQRTLQLTPKVEQGGLTGEYQDSTPASRTEDSEFWTYLNRLPDLAEVTAPVKKDILTDAPIQARVTMGDGVLSARRPILAEERLYNFVFLENGEQKFVYTEDRRLTGLAQWTLATNGSHEFTILDQRAEAKHITVKGGCLGSVGNLCVCPENDPGHFKTLFKMVKASREPDIHRPKTREFPDYVGCGNFLLML